MPTPKPKSERVQEAVQILKKMKEIGIVVSDPGYIETKSVLDTWIADGAEQKAEIFFRRYGRIGHMNLPAYKPAVATYMLKATEELKEHVDRMEAEESEALNS
jgi:hypothetical protein